MKKVFAAVFALIFLSGCVSESSGEVSSTESQIENMKNSKPAAPEKSKTFSKTAKTQATSAGSEVDYIGLSESDAAALARQNSVSFRVSERDGRPMMLTMDFRPGRINAKVEAGVVVDYSVEGGGALPAGTIQKK